MGLARHWHVDHWHELLFGAQVEGDITYNGHHQDEFVVQRTAAYIEQSDLHEPQVRPAATNLSCLDYGVRALC